MAFTGFAHFSIDGDNFVIFQRTEAAAPIEIMSAAAYHKDIGPLTPQPSSTSQDNLRLLAKELGNKGIQADVLKDSEAERLIIKNKVFKDIAELCCDIAKNLTRAHASHSMSETTIGTKLETLEALIKLAGNPSLPTNKPVRAGYVRPPRGTFLISQIEDVLEPRLSRKNLIELLDKLRRSHLVKIDLHPPHGRQHRYYSITEEGRKFVSEQKRIEIDDRPENIRGQAEAVASEQSSPGVTGGEEPDRFSRLRIALREALPPGTSEERLEQIIRGITEPLEQIKQFLKDSGDDSQNKRPPEREEQRGVGKMSR